MTMNIPMPAGDLRNECAGTAVMLAEAIHERFGVDFDLAREVIFDKLIETPSRFSTVFQMGVNAREKAPGRIAQVGIRKRHY